MVQHDNVLMPCLLFFYDRSKRGDISRKTLIDRLEGNFSVENFQDALIRNLEVKDSKVNSIGRSSGHSKGELIEQQKRELEELEREETRRRKLQEEERIEKERMEKEKIRKEQEGKKLVEKKLNEIPPEPSADDKESSLIIFRCPDGERRHERRFLKSHKVGCLYDFVDTLGKEIFEESDSYELIQPFPYKVYNDKEKTLEEEKLFPNAVLQIKEL